MNKPILKFSLIAMMLSLVALMDFGFYLGQYLCSCSHKTLGLCEIKQDQAPACCRAALTEFCFTQDFQAEAEILPSCCGSEQYRFEAAPFLRSEFELDALACACTACCGRNFKPVALKTAEALPQHFAPTCFELDQQVLHWSSWIPQTLSKPRHGLAYLAEIQVYRC